MFVPSLCSSCESTKDLKGKRAVRIYQAKGKKVKLYVLVKKTEVDIFFWWRAFTLLIFLLMLFQKKSTSFFFFTSTYIFTLKKKQNIFQWPTVTWLGIGRREGLQSQTELSLDSRKATGAFSPYPQRFGASQYNDGKSLHGPWKLLKGYKNFEDFPWGWMQTEQDWRRQRWQAQESQFCYDIYFENAGLSIRE